MKKRLLGILLSVMLISVCVGCGSESTSTEQTEVAQTATAEESTPEQTAEPIETPKETEEPHSHSYAEEITTATTCEADGLKTFTCECGDTYTEVVPATGHVFENYVSNNDATYLADGTETAKCNTCDLTDTRTAEGSKLEYTYTEMNVTMYATQTVNVRNLPNTDGEKVGSLSTNQEITVLGQCNETSWYQFELDGQTAFVSDKYLSTEKVEVASSAPAQEAAPEVSNIPRAADYSGGVWHNMGDYSFYIGDWKCPSGATGVAIHLNDGSAKWAWINYSDPQNVALNAFIRANQCNCNEITHGGIKPLWDEATKSYYFP